jgi:hypothetical protein
VSPTRQRSDEAPLGRPSPIQAHSRPEAQSMGPRALQRSGMGTPRLLIMAPQIQALRRSNFASASACTPCPLEDQPYPQVHMHDNKALGLWTTLGIAPGNNLGKSLITGLIPVNNLWTESSQPTPDGPPTKVRQSASGQACITSLKSTAYPHHSQGTQQPIESPKFISQNNLRDFASGCPQCTGVSITTTKFLIRAFPQDQTPKHP